MPEVTAPVRRADRGVADKVKPLAELAQVVGRLKSRGKRVVHCHGVFDLLHPGHIRHLKAAKQEGDVLVVTVTQDQYANKGPGRPVFRQHLRAESLAALQCVDYAAVNEWPTAVETIRLLQPDVYVKGEEYADASRDVTGKITDEEAAIHSVGGRLHFTHDITFSSSQLINDHLQVFPPETQRWLKAFRKRHAIDDVVGFLEGATKLKTLVIGEAMVRGISIVASDVGGITELAFTYPGLTLVPPGDSEALARQLEVTMNAVRVGKKSAPQRGLTPVEYVQELISLTIS